MNIAISKAGLACDFIFMLLVTVVKSNSLSILRNNRPSIDNLWRGKGHADRGGLRTGTRDRGGSRAATPAYQGPGPDPRPHRRAGGTGPARGRDIRAAARPPFLQHPAPGPGAGQLRRAPSP